MAGPAVLRIPFSVVVLKRETKINPLKSRPRLLWWLALRHCWFVFRVLDLDHCGSGLFCCVLWNARWDLHLRNFSSCCPSCSWAFLAVWQGARSCWVRALLLRSSLCCRAVCAFCFYMDVPRKTFHCNEMIWCSPLQFLLICWQSIFRWICFLLIKTQIFFSHP